MEGTRGASRYKVANFKFGLENRIHSDKAWSIIENIGFNTVPTDPFMSHLATQLGYSAGEFQALQLIVLAAFGVVD